MISSGNFPSSSSSVVAVGREEQRGLAPGSLSRYPVPSTLVGSQPGSSCSSSPLRPPVHTHTHTLPSGQLPAMEIPEQDTVLVTQPPKP